jgi:vitamin B12 transporter
MNRNYQASKWRLPVLAGFLSVGAVFAQDLEPEQLPAYVLTATRTPAALTTVGSYIDTISAAELARMQLTSLQSALSGIPGAPTLSSGAPGGVTSLFLRGANSNQTLFLVDGIRLSDPNTDYAVYLGGVRVGACDSLEVAHGPQSTLYGGEAMGGVLSLRAQRGSGPAAGAVSLEAGSFGTIQGGVQVQGGNGTAAYNFSATGGQTQNERRNNDFTSTTYVLRLDRQLNKVIAIGATWRGFVGKYGSPGDRYTSDPDNEDRESNQLATVFADFTPTVNFTSHAVLGGQNRRFVADEPGPYGHQVTIVKNDRLVLDWQNTLQVGERQRVTAGLTAEANHTSNNGFGDINKRQRMLAFFVQDEWTPAERVYFTAGLRNDDFDTFGRAITGRITAAWLSKDSHWKLRGSYGTAFRSPSFLDLYGRSAFYVGNPALRPEKARGWDTGVDYFLSGNRGVLSATWFATRFRDLIVYDFGVFPGTTANVQEALTKGLELSGKFPLARALQVRLTYTYLEADNLGDGTRLLRRPRHSGSLDLWHDLGRGFSAGTGVAFAAQREDVDAATFMTINGKDYMVVRIYGAWQVNARLQLRARVENLLNERYEQVNGYPQPGLGAYAGMELKF